MKKVETIKGVITAGGKGTRLYPISRAYPKELIPFCGIPVIEHSINILRDNGIKDIMILAGYRKGALQDYLGNGHIFGVNISYIIQEDPKGLGHAVQVIEPYIGKDEDFVLILGDNIYIGDVNLQQMVENHVTCDASSTIFIEHSQDPEKYGVVKFDNLESLSCKNITSLYEKPRDQKIKDDFKINSGWYTIAGIYVFNRNIFDSLRETSKGFNNEIQLTDAIKLSLERGNKTFGYIFNGRRIDVGTWNYLEEEKRFYNNVSDKDLKDVIHNRNMMMNEISTNMT